LEILTNAFVFVISVDSKLMTTATNTTLQMTK